MIKGHVTESRRRAYKLNERLYVKDEAKYLKKAEFDIGTHIAYEVDNVNRRVKVKTTEG